MAETGWQGLGHRQIKWNGQLYSDQINLLSPNSGTSGGVVWRDNNGFLSTDSSNFFWDDTNKRLGIGTNVPENDIHLLSEGSSSVIFADSIANTTQIAGRRANGTVANKTPVTANNLLLRVEGRGYGDTAYTGMRGMIAIGADENWSDTAQGTFIRFDTNVNGSAAAGVEKMRLTNAGRLGLGTTIPSELFHLSGGSAKISSGGTLIFGDSANANGFIIKTSANDGIIQQVNNAPISFYTTDTERMRITGDGKVGIGTTSPNQLFTISGGAFASNNTTAPTLTLTQVSGAFFVSGGAFFYKGDKGTITELAPR